MFQPLKIENVIISPVLYDSKLNIFEFRTDSEDVILGSVSLFGWSDPLNASSAYHKQKKNQSICMSE